MKISHLISGMVLSLAIGISVYASNNSNNNSASADSISYSLAGSMNNWSATDTTYDMTDSDGDGIYTTNVTIPGGNLTFKVVSGHSWDVSYGYDNLLVKHTSGTAWPDSDSKNIGLWNSANLEVTVGIRHSDKAIFVIPSNKDVLSFTKTFYLIVNNEEGDDWTNDWSNPRINYWGDGWAVIWDHSPSFVNLNRVFNDGQKTGQLFSIDLPLTTTGLLVAKQTLSDGQTENLDISDSTTNGAHFYYSGSNKLGGVTLETGTNGTYLRGDWGDNNYGWSEAGQHSYDEYDAPNNAYTFNNIELGAGGTVKMITCTNNLVTWCQPNEVSSNDDTTYPVEIADPTTHKNVTVINAGTYNITVTKNDDSWDYYFEGISNPILEAADAWARNFNSAISTKCDQSGNTNLTNLNIAWSQQATSYNKLDSEVQTFLSGDLSIHDTVASLQEFAAKYAYIYRKYGRARLTAGNFAHRNVSSSNDIGTITITNNNTFSIVLVTTMTITAIILTTYVYNRKKSSK